jgi:hypothetical protein
MITSHSICPLIQKASLHPMHSSSCPVRFYKGPRLVGLPRPRSKQPLHPNRASAPPPPPPPTAHPLTVLVHKDHDPIQRSAPPPSSPLLSPPLSPSPKRTRRRVSTPPLPLSLQFHTPVVINASPPPLPVATILTESPSPIPSPALTPPPTRQPISEHPPPQYVHPSLFPSYPDPREWTLAEILERCRTHAVYLQYRPSGYTGLVKSWEVLDAAVRKRHSEHSDEGWEKAFGVAHRNKRLATIE